MKLVGLWEQTPRLSVCLRASLPTGYRLRCGAELWEDDFPDLLTIAPEAPRDVALPPCRVLLLPGEAVELARQTPAQCVVSYGTAPKDTLTLSSLTEDRLCLAIQRELITLQGDMVERQECLLPIFQLPPKCLLAWAGTLLLLGVPVEALPEQMTTPHLDR